MSERESGGDPSIYNLRDQLTENVDANGLPDPDGKPRGMSRDAREKGNEPLKSAEEIEAELVAQEKADEEAVRKDVAAA